jgi:outer membrane protein OmpA-like peptidoglycan-associated protein
MCHSSRVIRRAVVRTALAAIALTGTSCVLGAKLRQDAQLIEKKVASARERGAYRCAPGELAEAETQLEFLDYELREGNFRRAKRHHDAALENVNRALRITDPNKCADKQVIIREDSDRDGDGVQDNVDQCPDEPEDRDGFEDENGCPDPDNDGDTVLDTEDKCPNVAGDPKQNGCPLTDRDGDGIADGADKCPDIPEDIDGNEDADGCPEEENLDSDGDGIVDASDGCPTEPEDADQFEDADGCPDPDNDMDTVLDAVDSCPLQPGPPANNGCPVVDRDGDGISDDIDQCPDVPGTPPNGCPKRVLVVKTDKKIEIKKQIRFATNKAIIRGAISFEILDQVASVLKSNPQLKVVVEGHTDSVGPADYNLRLSDSRAKAVREALVERGVEAKRLDAIGYGESKPIASNRSKKGRAANRRVEFLIVQAEAEQ